VHTRNIVTVPHCELPVGKQIIFFNKQTGVQHNIQIIYYVIEVYRAKNLILDPSLFPEPWNLLKLSVFCGSLVLKNIQLEF
jgi:hypothetical protein